MRLGTHAAGAGDTPPADRCPRSLGLAGKSPRTPARLADGLGAEGCPVAPARPGSITRPDPVHPAAIRPRRFGSPAPSHDEGLGVLDDSVCRNPRWDLIAI